MASFGGKAVSVRRLIRHAEHQQESKKKGPLGEFSGHNLSFVRTQYTLRSTI